MLYMTCSSDKLFMPVQRTGTTRRRRLTMLLLGFPRDGILKIEGTHRVCVTLNHVNLWTTLNLLTQNLPLRTTLPSHQSHQDLKYHC